MSRLPLLRRTPESPAAKPPRLVLRFAVFTALGLGLAATAIVVLVRKESTQQAERHAIERARFAAESVLKHELRPSDLNPPVPSDRSGDLDDLFERRVLLEGIGAVTLYTSDGRATYATGATSSPPSHYLQEALAGTAVSELATAEGGTRRVLRTYAPVVVGPPPTTGVAVIDQDYSRIEAAARRSAWVFAGVLEALLLLLFIILAPVLARVTRRIRRHAADLDHLATHDELTGLPNRLGLRRAGEQLLSRREPTALLIVDVDGFSEVNDSLGPGSGDLLLLQIGERLRYSLGTPHTVARLGEDEFGMLVPAPDHEQARAAADQISASLATPIVVGGIRVSVTVSIGLTLLGEHGPDFEIALRHAGAALSIAKLDGQHRVQVYDAAHATSDISRLTFAAEFASALEGGQLLLHYQPQADLTTRRIRGAEALLRWQHPERGLLPAHEFIHSAERSGLTRELRRFVFDSAARQWKEWSDIGIQLELSVNVSAVDILDTSLPEEIRDLIARYEIRPGYLILEITERILVGDEQRVRSAIERLVEIGARIAVDDFGMGYSSLSRLRRFPIHQVKLDRGLLEGVPGDAAAEAIVAGSVEIAHGLGATVVAEGVETREQWRYLYMLACDVAQGYLIARPAPAEELTALLDVPLLVPLSAA